MCKTIPTYYLYGLDAISAEVIVQVDGARVAERSSGRTLCEVKQEPSSGSIAGFVPAFRPGVMRLANWKPAPARIITGYLTQYHQ